MQFPALTFSMPWFTAMPTHHMMFRGKKENTQLAQTAANAVNFPQNIPAWDFSDGFNEDYLYIKSRQSQKD